MLTSQTLTLAQTNSFWKHRSVYNIQLPLHIQILLFTFKNNSSDQIGFSFFNL